MNRITYWIGAQTQYRVHSPFVFDLYRKVLFADLGRDLRKQALAAAPSKPGRRERQYHEIVYKMRDHFRLETDCYDGDEAVLRGDPERFGSVKIVCRPHRNRLREMRWNAQMDNEKYNLRIDLYDVGLLFSRPGMARQKFLLR